MRGAFFRGVTPPGSRWEITRLPSHRPMGEISLCSVRGAGTTNMLSTLKRKANVDVLPTRIEKMHKLTSLSGKSFFLTLSAVVWFPIYYPVGSLPRPSRAWRVQSRTIVFATDKWRRNYRWMAFPVVPYGWRVDVVESRLAKKVGNLSVVVHGRVKGSRINFWRRKSILFSTCS